MIKLTDIREGSIVQVRGDFGRSWPVLARVDNVEANVKNGCPGIDYTMTTTGNTHWAYLHQIDRVITY